MNDDFDKYCEWSRNPNEFMKLYQRKEMGSYEILDSNHDIASVEIINEDKEETDSISSRDITHYRVRSFRRTHKGVINEGDRLKACSLLSLNLPARSPSFGHDNNKSTFDFKYSKPDNISLSSPEEGTAIKLNEIKEDCFLMENEIPTNFDVLVVGSSMVGKTALCEQFLSSESAYFSEEEQDFDNYEMEIKRITVDLDDKEWNLMFKESNDFDINELTKLEYDALVIVYSIDNKESFDWCSQLLKNSFEYISQCAIFLVANKSDLERLRQVSRDKGKRLAEVYDGDFTEISTVLNQMVDHLLVELITKIRNHKRKLLKKKESISKLNMKYKQYSPANFFMNLFRKISKGM